MSNISGSCVFCDIIDGRAPAKILHRCLTSIIFRPLNPVTEGHVLVVPKTHVSSAIESPTITGATMECASLYLGYKHPSGNLITSVGEDATQSVFHLHIHVVPRTSGDGLKLPWTDQHA